MRKNAIQDGETAARPMAVGVDSFFFLSAFFASRCNSFVLSRQIFFSPFGWALNVNRITSRYTHGMPSGALARLTQNGVACRHEKLLCPLCVAVFFFSGWPSGCSHATSTAKGEGRD
nr:hypothetical protein [Pandoravirus belohorizontensis]